MKVNAVNGYGFSAVKNAQKNFAKLNQPEEAGKEGVSVISFRGGNPGDVLHVVGECPPLNKTGGVGTVVDDYKKLHNISASEKGRSVFVTPYYNGVVEYAKDTNPKATGLMKTGVKVATVPEGLPSNHPLRGKEGQPLYVKPSLAKTTLKDALSSPKNYFLLEEIADKKMSWGLQEDAPVKLFKVASDGSGKALKDDIFLVFTEATAYYPEPYAAGQYSSNVKPIVNSWNGDAYAKFDKAVVECMPDISKRISGFDPGTVVCSDSQAAYVTHYMAQRNAQGIEYFQGKKPIQIGHNLGDGYIGLTSPRNMAINLDLLKPAEWEALLKSEEFRKAIIEGGDEEAKMFEKFLHNMKANNKLSAMSIATHYGNVGYLPTWGVVSQGYLDEIAVNKEIAPFLYDDIKSLKEKGVLVGRTNPLNTSESAFTKMGLGGFANDQKVKLANGTEEIVSAMKMFTEADRADLTLEKVNALKRENKINFLERFLPKYDNAQLYNEQTKAWGKAGEGTSMLRAGLSNKEMGIVQNVDVAKYVAKLKKGEDVNVIVSWGRGDFQKAFDEVLNGFKKYAKKDPNAILILGGDLGISKEEGQKAKDIAELLVKDEAYKGRVMLLDGFAPGMPMAHMADVAIFPSRTAPCELTDLEAKRMLCTPVVANGQGLKQKNFDPGIASEAAMADAFKTKHQYFSSREELLKVASPETKDSFNKVFNKVKNNIETSYKVAMNETMQPERLEIFIAANPEYQDALRKLRDDVMSDEIAECLERKLIKHKNDDVARTILKNHANIKTGWEENQAITRASSVSGELYRSDFRKAGTKITSSNVIGIGHDLPLTADATETINKTGVTFGQKIKKFFGSKTGKWAAGIAGIIAVAGIGYGVYKNSKGSQVSGQEKKAKTEAVATNTSKTNKKEEVKHLSAVV